MLKSLLKPVVVAVVVGSCSRHPLFRSFDGRGSFQNWKSIYQSRSHCAVRTNQEEFPTVHISADIHAYDRGCFFWFVHAHAFCAFWRDEF